MERIIHHREPRDTSRVVLLLCISLIVMAVLAQTWWSIAQDKLSTLASAQENSFLAARILEEHANRILQDATRAIGAAAEEIQADEQVLKSEAATRQVLINQRQDSQFLQSISVISPSGILQASSFQFPVESVDLHHEPHILFLIGHPEDKNVIVGRPILFPRTQGQVLPVAKNIYNARGQYLGLIQTDINLGYFKEFYDRLAKDSNTVISLHNSEGERYLRVPYEELAVSGKVNLSPVVAAIQSDSAEGTAVDAPVDGGDTSLIYTYRKMADFPLTLVYARNVDDILEEWTQRSRQKFFLSLLTILFILLLVTLILRKIAHLRSSKSALADSESRYRLLFFDAQDAIFLINRNYVYVDCNKCALSLLGLSAREELLGKSVGQFSEDFQPGLMQPGERNHAVVKLFIDGAFDLAFDGVFDGAPQRFEWVMKRNGITLYNEVSLSQIDIGDEKLVFCMMRDVSARKYVEHLLEGQNQLLQLIGSSENLLLILEETCQYVEKMMPQWRCGIQLLDEGQRCFKQVIGDHFPRVLKQQLPGMAVSYGSGVWSEAVLAAKPIWITDIQNSSSMQFVNELETLQDFAACGSWPIMGKSGHLQGVFTLFTLSKEPLNGDALNFIKITTDIASIAIDGKRSDEKVLKLAHYDELTGLPNRFLYNQHLSKSLAHASRNQTRLAVLFLDLDRFKNINDTFGHDEGDLVLAKVAQRFQQCLRGTDTVARVGGDEFILLVDHYTDPKDLSDIAGKLLVAAALPFEIHDQECQLSASIGIATYPDDGGDAQTLMKNADIAMYRAKNKGKDNYQFYASEMNVHTIERLAFEGRLRRALERREFVVYYQPKVSVITGRIVGAEALVRWNHPERGILLPGEFITLAEEAGLVGRMGMLVLDIACRDILAFRAADQTFGRVAINLSGAQFNDIHLLEDVQAVIDFWRVDPHNIEFEITESMVMHNREQAIVLMDGLKKAGFTLSIDDFGTGYSSLAYLKRFPVDSVKIDRSFINDIPHDPNDTAIVLAIVAMAHTLGLKVIAEGVETYTQLQTLLKSSCDEYQGYYFSKAVPEHEFLQLLHRQEKELLF
jgi:diguanylate cyclase (GGDEF)-like protein